MVLSAAAAWEGRKSLDVGCGSGLERRVFVDPTKAASLVRGAWRMWTGRTWRGIERRVGQWVWAS